MAERRKIREATRRRTTTATATCLPRLLPLRQQPLPLPQPPLRLLRRPRLLQSLLLSLLLLLPLLLPLPLLPLPPLSRKNKEATTMTATTMIMTERARLNTVTRTKLMTMMTKSTPEGPLRPSGAA